MIPRLPDTRQRAYEYVPVRFLPDGSTDLAASGKWYVTILSWRDEMKVEHPSGGNSDDPIQGVNYFTLQVDPASGITRAFRPGK